MVAAALLCTADALCSLQKAQSSRPGSSFSHGQGSQRRNMPGQESCSSLLCRVFLNWEEFLVGNACWDSYRGINLPPRVCLCTWGHVHAPLSYPEGGILLCSCTEGLDVTRTATTPAALLRVPRDSQIICPSVWKLCQSYSTQVYHAHNFFLLWLALTSVEESLREPADCSRTAHKPQHTYSSAAAPQPCPAARLLPPPPR